MPTASDPRITFRASPEDRETLERYSRVAGVAVGALCREVTLAFGPVWVANRAADRVAGREVKPARGRNRVQAVRPWVEVRP